MSTENLSFDLDAIVNRGKKNFKKSETLKQGVSVYRILPSAFSTTRQLSKFWAVHWLTGPNGKKMQVECTQYKEKFCPICNAHREVEEELKRAKANGNKDLVDKLSDTEQALRASRHVYYNALNAGNEIIILKLSSTVSKQLEEMFARSVREKGFDPISPTTGVWFEFVKSGIGRDSVRVDYKRDPKTDQRDHNQVADETMRSYLNGGATNIYTSEGLNIKQFSAAQLAGYLQGQPLELSSSSSGSSSSSEDGSEEPESDLPIGSTPMATASQVATSVAAVQSAPAPEAVSLAATASAEAAAASRQNDLERLRKLMASTKK